MPLRWAEETEFVRLELDGERNRLPREKPIVSTWQAIANLDLFKALRKARMPRSPSALPLCVGTPVFAAPRLLHKSNALAARP